MSNKLIDDTTKEHGEFSIKRILVWVFTGMALFLCVVFAIAILAEKEIKEAYLFLFGELLSFIGLLLGLTVANKHNALRNTTNAPPPEDVAQ